MTHDSFGSRDMSDEEPTPSRDDEGKSDPEVFFLELARPGEEGSELIARMLERLVTARRMDQSRWSIRTARASACGDWWKAC